MSHAFGTKKMFARLCAHLLVHGVKEVVVDFDGRRWDGLGDVSLVFADGHEGDAEKILGTSLQALRTTSKYDYKKRQWIRSTVPALMSVEELLKDATNVALEESGLDWYNNDGGFGKLFLRLCDSNTGRPELVLDMNIRVTSIEKHAFVYTDGFEKTTPKEEG